MTIPVSRNRTVNRFVPGLRRWVDSGIEPGGFLCAVLRNDLRDALARADYASATSIQDLVTYMERYLPGDCWGSPEKFEQWRRDRG